MLLSVPGVARTIPGAAVLLGLGLALSSKARVVVSSLAIGLIGGWVNPQAWSPDPEAPVVLVAHLDGHWSSTPEGTSVAVRGEWLRVGGQVRAWRNRVVITLPVGSDPPESYRLRARGYLRRPEPLANGVSILRPGWRLYAKSVHFTEPLPGWGIMPRIHGLSALARVRIRDALQAQEAAGSAGAYLIQALVLGEGWALPSSWRRGLQACGLSHLIALSGLHVGLLAGMALALTFWLPTRARAALIMALAISYLLFVGPRPSLIRACCMLIGLWLALWLRRSPLPGNTLAVVAAMMLVARPQLIGDLGFRLTVSATAGILVLSPVLGKSWTRLPGWLSRSLSVTVGAQLGTLPWAIPEFHLFTPLSPVWNLFAIPWTALALGISMVWSFVAIGSPGLAAKLTFLVDLAAIPFAGVADLSAFVTRPIIVDWGYSSAFLMTLVLVGLLAGRKLRLPAIALLGVVLASGGQSAVDSPELVLTDVGQGESILLRDGQAAVLLDGGGWRRADIGTRVLLPVLSSLGVRRLNALILSHPDLDHCAGLVQIASFLPVDEVWSAPGWSPKGCVADLYGLPRVRIRSLWAGEEMRVGRWELRVLNPPPGMRRGVNDRSLVLLARIENRSLLLTGDIEESTEHRLLRAYPEALRDVDVLKVAHHGSRTSSTAEWLDHTHPSLALISAGIDNRYGHPSLEVIQRLADRGALTLRTDQQGLVRLAIGQTGALKISLPGMPRSSR